ncbi:MAG: hypothetical protein RIS35_154 [Pseudomonadota bacterium]|jgi:hypothetical protein
MSTTGRTLEKIGWTAGWIGSFVWVLVLSVVFAAQGDVTQGLAGLGLTAVAAVVVVLSAPWRFPGTRYWKLMVAPGACFAASIAWGIWSFGGFDAGTPGGWTLAWLLPLSIPVLVVGRKRWQDG